MLPRPVTENPGELIHAWLGVRAHTTRWNHAVQKAEKVDEPLRHDSFALLAPKSRNNRNQELEKKSVKEKPRILFPKTLNSDARAATGPRQSKDDGPAHTPRRPIPRSAHTPITE